MGKVKNFFKWIWKDILDNGKNIPAIIFIILIILAIYFGYRWLTKG